MRSHITLSPVAKSVPHELIEGLEQSSDVEVALREIFKLFRTIMKEPTGFTNKYLDSRLTWSDANRSLTIEPRSPAYPSYEFFIRGKGYTVTSPKTFQVTDTEGIWYFYLDANETLQGSQTKWEYGNPISFVSVGYWDSANKKWIRKSEERHGLIMDSDTHRNMHETDGVKISLAPNNLEIVNYTTTGAGNNNSDAQFGITDGRIFDEDLPIDIRHSNTPAAEFEQVLYPIAYTPVFYLTGIGYWRMKTATQFPFYENPPNLPYYNRYNGGGWTLEPVPNGNFFATFLVYTSDEVEPVISILGQRTDTTLIDAVNNNTKSGLQFPKRFSEEIYFYRKLIWEVSTSFTNTPKCRLKYVTLQTETNPANDRYPADFSYNGNASPGKYLEFYPGQPLNTAPFPIPEPSFLKTVIVRTAANSTAVLGIYKLPDLTTPVLTLNYNNSTYFRYNFAYLFNSDDQIAMKVISGSMNKPAALLFFQTNL